MSGLFGLLAAARSYRAGGAGPKATLLAIVERVGQVDGEWVCWPTMATVAYDSEQGVGTVRRHLAVFEQAGLIERRSRGAEGGGRASNLLVLNADMLLGQSAHGERFAEGGQSAHPGGAKRASGGGQSAHPGGPVPLIEHPREEPGTSNAVRLPIGPTFDDFYRAFPRREGVGAARTAWAKAVKKADPAAIVAGARRYAADPNRSPEFTKTPGPWLNAERWNDEPLPPRAQQRGARAPQRIDTDRSRPSEVVNL